MELIEFYPLKGYLNEPQNRDRIDASIKRVLEEDILINGKQVMDFQRNFSKYVGTKYCIGTGNGHDSLTLALRGLSVSNGDEVIVPAFTFIATWFCVETVSATPVPCDVGENGQLDLEKCKIMITSRTRAVIFVHLYGIATDLTEFAKYLKDRNIFLIEDCAQATGARINERHVGTFGDIGCFSFYPTKNLGALGDGGAIVTDNEKVALTIDSIRNFGVKESKYNHEIIGVNSRLDTIQAAWLTSQLDFLDQENSKRKFLAKEMHNALLESSYVTTLNRLYDESSSDVFHLFVVLCKRERNKVIEKLEDLGIGYDCHYPRAIVEQKVYSSRNFKLELFPNSIKLAQTVVSLPLYPWITEQVKDELVSRLRFL